jgi:fatty acid desaturase
MKATAIDRDAVQTLSVPSSGRAWSDFALTWGIIAGTVAAAKLSDNVYVYALAIVIIGSRQNALATLAHEGWHSLIVSSRRLNHFIASWCYAYPLGILYYHDRERHLRHHREVGNDFDPDWINYTSRNRETPMQVVWYLASLLMGHLLFSTIFSIAKRGRPRIAVESAGTAASRELFRVGICQAVLLTTMTLATHRWWTYPLLWVLPLATFAGFFANFRALIEHVSARDDVPPENRLRDIHAGPIERFLIAPSHFNYHALHHAYPSLPHYNLPRGKQAYLLQFGRYPFTVRPGYTKALFAHLNELRLRT